MGRIARSWAMAKTSFRVVRQDPELAWLPVLSFLATIITVLAIAGIGWGAGVTPQVQAPDGSIDPVAAVLAFATYLGLAFVQVFFYAAMVAGANERLGGGDPTVGSSLRKAWAHVGVLFAWSMVVATVNVILQMLRERGGILGQVASSIAGVAWNLATYFVVPLLLFDDLRVGSALKRSGGLFKRNWGEQVIGEFGLGMVSFLAVLAVGFTGILLSFALGMLGAWGFLVGLVITVVAVLLTMALFTVATAVYKTALYRHATGAKAGGPFDDQTLANAFHAR